MKTRAFIGISAVLNLILATALWLAVGSRRAPGPSSVEKPAAEPVVSADVAVPPASALAAPALFHWSQLVSDDLKIYRDNLRAVGCPALTVRDIIMAQINEQFLQRRKELLASFQNRFWDLAIRGEPALRGAWSPPLEALAAERLAMINDVLGNNYDIEGERRQNTREALRNLSWLPPEKQAQWLAINDKYQRRLEELTRESGEQYAGSEQMRQLQKELEEAHEDWLTPEEAREFELRASRESLWAAGLSGFEPTEEEWRAVTRLRTEVARRLADGDITDEERRKRQETFQADLTNATREALDAERFAQYEIASDTQFQDVFNVTQRYGLPEQTALRAYEILQTARDRAEQVRAHPFPSREAQATLTAIRQETERALSETLGPRVLATYKEYGGDWIANLDRND